MKKIKLTKGKFALVDDEDFEYLLQWKWKVKITPTEGLFYAVRNGLGKERNKVFRMHRVIMQCPESKVVDHRDGDGLNNTRCNMRICTMSENLMNSRKKRKNKRFKGTVFLKYNGRWKARICSNYKVKNLGIFLTEDAAARAYDVAAKELFKEFALLNFTTSE